VVIHSHDVMVVASESDSHPAITRTTPYKEFTMNQQFQRDIDNAATDRDKAQVKASKERMEAIQDADKKVAKADEKFVKAADKAEASAMNRDPITGSPGSHPIGTGIGTTGGMVAGAAAGSLAGPVGTVVGGVVGAIVGAAAGHGVGEAVNPTDEDAYWQRAFITEPYYNKNLSYDDYGPAYRAGYMHRSQYADRTWEQVEPELMSDWDRSKGASTLRWEEARNAAEAAWRHAGTSNQ